MTDGPGGANNERANPRGSSRRDTVIVSDRPGRVEREVQAPPVRHGDRRGRGAAAAGWWLISRMLVPCRRAKETSMKPVLFNVGRLAGLVGMLLMAVAVLARLMGHFMLGGFATGTLMLAGIGAVGVGCFLLLWTIAERLPRP